MKITKSKRAKIELTHGEILEMILEKLGEETMDEEWIEENLDVKFFVTEKRGDQSVHLRAVCEANLDEADGKEDTDHARDVVVMQEEAMISVLGYAGDPPSEYPFHLEPRGPGEGIPEPSED
jgi:hypothetical protein